MLQVTVFTVGALESIDYEENRNKSYISYSCFKVLRANGDD